MDLRLAYYGQKCLSIICDDRTKVLLITGNESCVNSNFLKSSSIFKSIVAMASIIILQFFNLGNKIIFFTITTNIS